MVHYCKGGLCRVLCSETAGAQDLGLLRRPISEQLSGGQLDAALFGTNVCAVKGDTGSFRGEHSSGQQPVNRRCESKRTLTEAVQYPVANSVVVAANEKFWEASERNVANIERHVTSMAHVRAPFGGVARNDMAVEKSADSSLHCPGALALAETCTRITWVSKKLRFVLVRPVQRFVPDNYIFN